MRRRTTTLLTSNSANRAFSQHVLRRTLWFDNANSYQLFSESGMDFIITFRIDTGARRSVACLADNLLQTHSNR